MSIQKNSYTSKKTGKTKVQYYASVWYADEGRPIIGPMRDTPKLAKQDETDIQRDVAAGKAKAAKKKRSTATDEIYQIWHEATAPPTYANSTWRVYERFYTDYIKDVFGDRQIGTITPMHIQKFVTLMKGKYEPETVNKIINILTNIFNYAIDPLKCTTANPVSGVKRCKVPRKSKTTWSDTDITYFLSLEEVRKSHYYPMLCLSALLGPRPGEVCGLRERALLRKPTYCLDFDRGYDNWACETDMKNNQSHRMPPIPKHLYEIIHKKLLWKKERRLGISDWGENDYLFVSQNGFPIKPHQYSVAFKRLLITHNSKMQEYMTEHGKLPTEDKTLPYITLYGFRTSFATNNMRRTPNAALISSVMGNSPKTLLQFYAQSDITMQMDLIKNYVKIEKTIS